MRLLAIALLAAALLAGPAAGSRFAGGSAHRAVPRLQCEQPARLRLERYEDGSARLLCGPRLLARIAVPW